jgi:hypothetical protein
MVDENAEQMGRTRPRSRTVCAYQALAAAAPGSLFATSAFAPSEGEISSLRAPI